MRTLEKSAINFLIADRTETVYSTESSKGQVQLQESAKEFFNLLVTHHYLSADNSERKTGKQSWRTRSRRAGQSTSNLGRATKRPGSIGRSCR
jgi:hypothetical protein